MTPKAQPVTVYTTTENQTWQQSKATLSNKAEGKEIATVDGTEQGITFGAWGTTFNELAKTISVTSPKWLQNDEMTK